MAGWAGMLLDEGRGLPQDRGEVCTGERSGFRRTFLRRSGRRGGRSVRWRVREGECRARESLRGDQGEVVWGEGDMKGGKVPNESATSSEFDSVGKGKESLARIFCLFSFLRVSPPHIFFSFNFSHSMTQGGGNGRKAYKHRFPAHLIHPAP